MKNKERYTISQIRDANTRGGYYFFRRDTMRFHGDRVSSFRVRHISGRVYVVRVTGREVWYEFNPADGDLSWRGESESEAAAYNYTDDSALRNPPNLAVTA